MDPDLTGPTSYIPMSAAATTVVETVGATSSSTEASGLPATQLGQETSGISTTTLIAILVPISIILGTLPTALYCLFRHRRHNKSRYPKSKPGERIGQAARPRRLAELNGIPEEPALEAGDVGANQGQSFHQPSSSPTSNTKPKWLAWLPSSHPSPPPPPPPPATAQQTHETSSLDLSFSSSDTTSPPTFWRRLRLAHYYRHQPPADLSLTQGNVNALLAGFRHEDDEWRALRRKVSQRQHAALRPGGGARSGVSGFGSSAAATMSIGGRREEGGGGGVDGAGRAREDDGSGEFEDGE